MYKKILVFTIIILTAIALVASVFPKLKERNINSRVEKANYCNVDTDCLDAGGKCPFGCYNYVNKDSANEISRLIESFDSRCVYGCLSCPTAICENNKCKASCDEGY